MNHLNWWVVLVLQTSVAYGNTALDNLKAGESEGIVGFRENLSLRLAERPPDLLVAHTVLQELDFICLRHQLGAGLLDDPLGFLDFQSQGLQLQALEVEISLLIEDLRLHLVDVSLVVVHPDINL
jgi:hypothetical protein